MPLLCCAAVSHADGGRTSFTSTPLSPAKSVPLCVESSFIVGTFKPIAFRADVTPVIRPRGPPLRRCLRPNGEGELRFGGGEAVAPFHESFKKLASPPFEAAATPTTDDGSRAPGGVRCSVPLLRREGEPSLPTSYVAASVAK